jgi:hypothetical protein
MTGITIRSTNIDNIELGPLRARYSARGDRVLRYHVDIAHKAMNLDNFGDTIPIEGWGPLSNGMYIIRCGKLV